MPACLMQHWKLLSSGACVELTCLCMQAVEWPCATNVVLVDHPTSRMDAVFPFAGFFESFHCIGACDFVQYQKLLFLPILFFLLAEPGSKIVWSLRLVGYMLIFITALSQSCHPSKRRGLCGEDIASLLENGPP